MSCCFRAPLEYPYKNLTPSVIPFTVRVRHLVTLPGSSSAKPSTDDHCFENAALNSHHQLTGFDHVSQCPILTSFVSSLEQGSAFRVSVHSWEPPKPSQVLSTFKRHDEVVAYEARVYIDGDMVAQRIFGSQAVWPEVIERTGSMFGASQV